MRALDRRGRSYSLEAHIADGGEATIHPVAGYPHSVAKIYKPGIVDGKRHRKLTLMLANPPDDPTARQGHRSIAWPEEILTVSGSFAGFLMPRVDTRSYRVLLALYNIKNFPPGIDWQHLVLVARNLSGTLQALHDKGYVVGDLNESNVLAGKDCRVTFVDCDSMQVPDPNGGRVYRCTVGKPDYTPPEDFGKSYGSYDRSPESDRFALAVLICQLLMLGRHPFAGGHHQYIAENINRKDCFLLRRGRGGPRATPPIEVLPQEIRDLFVRCFEAGHHRPTRRPAAWEWRDELDRLYAGLKRCSAKPHHAYGKHLNSCPWCSYSAREGFDPFNLRSASAPPPQRPSPGGFHPAPLPAIPGGGLPGPSLPPTAGPPVPTPGTLAVPRSRRWAPAAILLLVVTATFIGWQHQSQSTAPRSAARPEDVGSLPVASPPREVRASELPQFFTGTLGLAGSNPEPATLTIERITETAGGGVHFSFVLNALSFRLEGIGVLEPGGLLRISDSETFTVRVDREEIVLTSREGLRGELRGWL